MNAYDELLVWASEVKAGSVDSLRAAAASAVPTRPAREVVDDLVALGHVQLTSGRWSVARPALVRLASSGGNSIVVGARPRWLLEVGRALEADSDPDLIALGDYMLENMFVPQSGPSTWFLSFGPEAPMRVLDDLGVVLLDDVSGGLMNQVLTDGPPGEPRSVRPGELVAYLVHGTGEVPVWDPASDDTQPGGYAYLRNNQRVYALRTSDGWFETGQRWVEWLGTEGNSRQLWSVPREAVLFVRASHRLPTLVERALVQRTGRLPEMTTLSGSGDPIPVRRYTNIPNAMAEQVARVLNKELHLA